MGGRVWLTCAWGKEGDGERARAMFGFREREYMSVSVWWRGLQNAGAKGGRARDEVALRLRHGCEIRGTVRRLPRVIMDEGSRNGGDK